VNHAADLSVFHVDLYQSSQRVTQSELQYAVEAVFGRLSRAQYAVRYRFLVEETILDEGATEDADMVVIGRKQTSRWQRMIQRITGEPNVESFLRKKLDCQIITAPRE
jgi:nucleotide-binding universal stress UspA family protein